MSKLVRWAGVPCILSALIFVGCQGAEAAAPRVVAVYPSGETVHENLLRISIRFASPADGERSLAVGLKRQRGREVKDVFDRNTVWSPGGRVLTLLLGPGRVKTGLVAHDQLGRALTSGESVSLSLAGRVIKTWRVIGNYNARIEPGSWILAAPREQTRQALLLSFAEPIDGMDEGFIVVLGPHGERIEGQSSLLNGEAFWRFIPSQNWTPGDYTILINPRLEDSCGNSVASAFEQSSASRLVSSPVGLKLKIIY